MCPNQCYRLLCVTHIGLDLAKSGLIYHPNKTNWAYWILPPQVRERIQHFPWQVTRNWNLKVSQSQPKYVACKYITVDCKSSHKTYIHKYITTKHKGYHLRITLLTWLLLTSQKHVKIHLQPPNYSLVLLYSYWKAAQAQVAENTSSLAAPSLSQMNRASSSEGVDTPPAPLVSDTLHASALNTLLSSSLGIHPSYNIM